MQEAAEQQSETAQTAPGRARHTDTALAHSQLAVAELQQQVKKLQSQVREREPDHNTEVILLQHVDKPLAAGSQT